jgi:hypothetical protein
MDSSWTLRDFHVGFIVENRSAMSFRVVVLSRVDGPEHRTHRDCEYAEAQEYQ